MAAAEERAIGRPADDAVEEVSILRLTTARPHELAAALSPRLRVEDEAVRVAQLSSAEGRGLRLAVVPDPGPRPAVPVDAALWLEVGALIPEVARRRRQPGRRRRDDRAVLEGILHVLATGIGWRELPQELGCGSGVTCWRRLREWVDGGTWATVEPVLRAALGPADVDWERPWAGIGRPEAGVAVGAAASPAGAVRGAAAGNDPGATDHATARRRAWVGPSLV
jgi:transposase